MVPIPITIITGFLGSGKTTLILNLIPQLPPTYRLALLKNEFGDVAIDSQLASSKAISGVQELLNGCICCNLVGQLKDALETLRTEVNPDRIVIETSGSAFPATLAMEVNRLAKETSYYVLDGVLSVIDVENWKGYDDTSYTAKVQAQYTDLIVLNKWELVNERKLEECIDRILDLELDVPVPREKSVKGWISKDLVFGLDAKLASLAASHGSGHQHDHSHDHHSEVEVLSVTLAQAGEHASVELAKLNGLLKSASKDEIYRIKAILYTKDIPKSSTGDVAVSTQAESPRRFILNWAFGRWTFTFTPQEDDTKSPDDDTRIDSGISTPTVKDTEPALRMTIMTARYESTKWRKRIEAGEFIGIENEAVIPSVERIS
jgi:G3E family GTPase